MTKRIEFEGKVHEFPDNATDDEIRTVLEGESKPPDDPQLGIPSQSKPNDFISGFVDRGVDTLKGYGQVLGGGASALGDLFTGNWEGLKQKGIGLSEAIAQPMRDTRAQAAESMKRGRYLLGAEQYLLGLTPLVGPYVNELSADLAERPGYGLGEAAGDLLTLGIGKGLNKLHKESPRLWQEGARTSMGRALDPTGEINKLDSPQVIDQLLKEWRSFTGPDDLIKEFDLRKTAATAEKARLRSMVPPDYSFTGQELMDAVERAKSKFRKVGGKTGGTATNTQAMAELDNLVLEMRKTLMPPGTPQNLLDLPAAYLESQGFLPQLNPNSLINVDLVDNLKQVWQNTARRHGKYTGKETYGMTLESTPQIEAMSKAADELRGLLNNKMPKGWDAANQEISDAINIIRIANARKRANLGTMPPQSETGIGGLGSKMGWTAGGTGMGPLTGMDVRLFRRLRGSPLYQSGLANTKQMMGIGSRIVPSQVTPAVNTSAFFLGRSPESVPMPDLSELPLSPSEPQPAPQPMRQRLRWDQDSQQFLPVE